MEAAPSSSFLVRNEFLIRRLFSLAGVIPVGAYMVIHLLTNAMLLNGAASYQYAVYQIHSLGMVLPIVEWVFIFIPLLFHAIIGVVIIRGALPNSGTYPTSSNIRYTLQRATGLIAFVFIFWHVFHMHGWIHASWWTDNISRPFSGGLFRPYNAATSTAQAMTMLPILVPVLYLIGVLASVFHLANGIWSFGITWGIWTTQSAMNRASVACAIFGVLLAGVGVAAWLGPIMIAQEENLHDAYTTEMEMYRKNRELHRIPEDEHKLSEEPPEGWEGVSGPESPQTAAAQAE